jgi:hypothetical protein
VPAGQDALVQGELAVVRAFLERAVVRGAGLDVVVLAHARSSHRRARSVAHGQTEWM